MPVRIAKTILSFILIISVLSGLSLSSSAVFDPEVTEIDIIIKPNVFDALLTEENRKKEFTVLSSVNGGNYESVTVNTRGSSTFEDALMYDTKRFPLEITFRNRSQQFGKNYSLKLNNSFSLYNLIAEYLAMKIYEHMDVPVSETFPVFLSFNGVDFGLYLGVEDVNKNFLINRYGNDAAENGTLYKSVDVDSSTENSEKHFPTSCFGTLYAKCGKDDHETLLAFLDALDNGGDFEKYLDIDEVLKFFACTAASGGTDTVLTTAHNVYLYVYNGKISFIPWDLSCAFDCFDDFYCITPDFDTNSTSRVFNLIMSNDDNQKKYYGYIEEIRETFLKPEIIDPLIDSFVSEVANYCKRDRSVILSTDVMLENITSGNSLVNGNIRLAVSEVYRQIGEQLSGEAEHFYTPESMKTNLLNEFPEEELRSDNNADVLTDIKNNYIRAYIKTSVDKVGIIAIGVFFVVLVSLFVSYRIPKGHKRKRNKT